MHFSGEENAPPVEPLRAVLANDEPDADELRLWLASPLPTPARASNHTDSARRLNALFAAAQRASEFAPRERYELRRRMRGLKHGRSRLDRRIMYLKWYNAWLQRTENKRYGAGMRCFFP